jgi:asparagine synthase (glutamine-hydrolysing)
MCGIVGGAGGDIPHETLNRVVVALRHRGPDDEGLKYWNLNGAMFAFGHTRLAINDLSNDGAQPMTKGPLSMVFNGEIYNYPELRKYCESRGSTFRSSMDGEVILHLWAQEGPLALARLNGIFSIAMLDEAAGSLWLARDPLGVKPLFYSSLSDGSLRFASELSALRLLVPDDGGNDVVALAQFLSFLWVPDPATPYRRMRSVEPGGLVRWQGWKTTVSRYISATVPEPQSGENTTELVQSGLEKLDAAAKRQLLSDVPIGLMASGGIDSGLIWSSAARGLSKAYTVTWKQGGDERLDEDVRAVELIRRRFGTEVSLLKGEGWQRGRLPPSGDLLADPAYELTRLIACAARRDGVKVLLSGHGGDELFGGYRRHQAAWLLERVHVRGVDRAVHQLMTVLPGRALRREYVSRIAAALAERDPFRRYMQLCTYSSAADRARILDTTEAEVSDEVVWQRHADVFCQLPEKLSLLRKAMTVDLRVYLPGLGLAYADRAAMEEGIEVRVPLLDLEFVNWSLTLPDSALIRRGRGKWAAKQMALTRLPKAAVVRAKRGFGAPSAEFATAGGRTWSKGFRQASYLEEAARMLAALRAPQGCSQKSGGT